MGLMHALVEPRDLHLNRLQLCDDRLAGKASIAWQRLIVSVRRRSHQLLQSLAPLRGHQPELSQVGAYGVDELRALASCAASARSAAPYF
jgi:hypothetical protein